MKEPVLPPPAVKKFRALIQLKIYPVKGKPVVILQLDMCCFSHTAAQTLVQV